MRGMAMGKASLCGGSVFRQITDYPRCKIFQCVRLRGVAYRCCYFCPKKENCHDPCLNNPDKCGQCIIPEKEGDKQYGA